MRTLFIKMRGKNGRSYGLYIKALKHFSRADPEMENYCSTSEGPSS